MTSAILDILFSVLIAIGGISISGTSVTADYDKCSDYGFSSSAVDSIIDGVPVNSSDRADYLKNLSRAYSFLLDNCSPLGAIDDINQFINDSSFALQWAFIEWLADNKSNINEIPNTGHSFGTITLDNGCQIVTRNCLEGIDKEFWQSEITIYNSEGNVIYSKKGYSHEYKYYTEPTFVTFDDCFTWDNPNQCFVICNEGMGCLVQKSERKNYPGTYDVDILIHDLKSVIGTYTADPETIPSNIGSVDVNGQSVPINPDGSITVDGQTYSPSADGYHIGDNVYNPTFDLSQYSDAALIDLLNRLLEALEGSNTAPTDVTGFLSRIIEGITGVKTSILDFAKSVTSTLTDIKELITADPEARGYDINDNWGRVIELFKRKFGYYAFRESISNISNDIFSVRVIDNVSDNSISYSINNNSSNIVPPAINITLFGATYNLMQGLVSMGNSLSFAKSIISFLLWAYFIIFIFRSLPEFIKSASVSSNAVKGG